MYHVRCKTQAHAELVRDLLRQRIAESRFVVDNICVIRHGRSPWRVNIETIRLRRSKGYCGNHAGPCRVTGGRHRKSTCLEGADWVAFNNMVNDVLDNIHHDGDAGSRFVKVRLGKQRRIDYSSFGHGDWIPVGEPGDYADYCGKEPPEETEYPSGTPGYDGWTREVEACYD